MGVIVRQSTKSAIVNYVGILVSYFSVFFVYLKNESLYGTARFIIDAAMLVAPFLIMGMNVLPTRYFSKYDKTEAGHGPFLTMLFCGAIGLIGIFSVIYFVFQARILEWITDENKSALYNDAVPYILPTAAIFALSSLLINYISNFKRIVVPAILNDLLRKVFLPISILVVVYGIVKNTVFPSLILGMHILTLIGLVAYVFYLGELKIRSFKPLWNIQVIEEFGTYAFFGFLTILGAQLSVKLDSIMITKIIDETANGQYQILAMLVSIIIVPSRAIYAISNPLISESMNKDDLHSVQNIYRKSSLVLWIAGTFLFGLIFLNVIDVLSLFDKNYEHINVLLIITLLGISYIIEMGTSVNTSIIIHSRFFRANLFILLGMGILNIMLNILFINRFGVLGAALATMISWISINIIKTIFVYSKFKMNPFNINHIWVLMIAGIALLLVKLIDQFDLAIILNIALKSLTFTLLFVPIIVTLKISDDLNMAIKNIYKRILK